MKQYLRKKRAGDLSCRYYGTIKQTNASINAFPTITPDLSEPVAPQVHCSLAWPDPIPRRGIIAFSISGCTPAQNRVWPRKIKCIMNIFARAFVKLKSTELVA